ncbi:MarR family transcriptional regulator [Sphingomonas sp. RB3P16]|uniref:MarR family winged helix-turn-helix transcriptional regulator n=1 Tax=Parasphingomonas frigoris TaxID=3096163 RepID=UPI002FCC40EE
MVSQIGYQLRRVDLISMEALSEELAKLGVAPGRATALSFIHLNPGSDQAALGRVLGINAASTMAAVNGLVALGAVERRPGRDRRSNALHLTDQGRRLHDEVVELIDQHNTNFFAALTPDESAELFRLLVKVRASHSTAARSASSTTRAILRRVK